MDTFFNFRIGWFSLSTNFEYSPILSSFIIFLMTFPFCLSFGMILNLLMPFYNFSIPFIILWLNFCLKWFVLLTFFSESFSSCPWKLLFVNSSLARQCFPSACLSVLILPSLLLWPFHTTSTAKLISICLLFCHKTGTEEACHSAKRPGLQLQPHVNCVLNVLSLTITWAFCQGIWFLSHSVHDLFWKPWFHKRQTCCYAF